MHFKMSPAICFNLDQSKILPSGNGLRYYKTSISYIVLTLSFSNSLPAKSGFKTASNDNARFSEILEKYMSCRGLKQSSCEG